MDKQETGNIKIKLSTNIDEFILLSQEATSKFEELKKTLDKINNFKVVVYPVYPALGGEKL